MRASWVALALSALCTQAWCAPQDDFDRGRMYRNGAGVQRDSVRAFALIRQAARDGHAPAMFILSAMLAAGEGAPQDASEARRYLEVAAELELPEAMQQLAMYLQEGALGYERDAARAAQLMNEVAHAMKHR
jgi:TPR repeat protein